MTCMGTAGFHSQVGSIQQVLIDVVRTVERCKDKLTRLIFAGVRLDDVVVKPHVSDRHAVLRQRAGLV